MADDSGFTWSQKPVQVFKKGLRGLTDNNDPTYLGFVFLFDFNNRNKSPLLVNDETSPGTAVNYLKRIGEESKKQYLQNFINNLQVINRRMPWYWQSVEGVNQLWEYENFQNPYRGTIGNDKKLTISCLESIDLRITMIMDLYRKAAYDLEFRRMVLPENLQRFRVWLWVQEIRKFQVAGGKERVSKNDRDGEIGNIHTDPINATTNSVSDPEADQRESVRNTGRQNPTINEKSPYILFQIEGCHWLTDDSGGFLNNLSNSEPEQSAQQVSFRWENVFEIGNQYPLSDIKLGNRGPIPKNFNVQKTDEPEIQQRNDLLERGENVLNNFATNAESFAEQSLEAQLSSAVLGNVYGISPTNIADALRQGSVQSLGFDLQSEIIRRTGVGNIGQLYNQPFVNNSGNDELNSDNNIYE